MPASEEPTAVAVLALVDVRVDVDGGDAPLAVGLPELDVPAIKDATAGPGKG